MRRDNNDFLLVMGGLLGVSIALLVFAELGAFGKLSEEKWAFIGSLLGAAASVWAAYLVVRHQLAAREGERAADLDRQRRAAMAIFANDLAFITDYVRDSVDVAKEAVASIESRSVRQQLEPFVAPGILERTQRLIEVLDGPDAEVVVQLMHAYQIHGSRVRNALRDLNRQIGAPGVHGPVATRHTFAPMLETAVEVYLRAIRMFGWARLDIPNIDLSPYDAGDIELVLRILDLFDWLRPEERANIDGQLSRIRLDRRSYLNAQNIR